MAMNWDSVCEMLCKNSPWTYIAEMVSLDSFFWVSNKYKQSLVDHEMWIDQLRWTKDMKINLT